MSRKAGSGCNLRNLFFFFLGRKSINPYSFLEKYNCEAYEYVQWLLYTVYIEEYVNPITKGLYEL